ncbi:MAG: FecR family protein, partial [bacterium]
MRTRDIPLTLCSILLLLAVQSACGATPAPVAEFTKVTGDVRVLRGPKKELIDGEEDVDIFEGDEVATLANGAATISFVDHHLLKLGPRTTLVIKTVKADPVKQSFLGRVRLVTGRLFASFGKAAGGGRTGFAVETRSAVAAVKGTTFGVEEGDAGTSVSVDEGVVATSPVDEAGREGAAVDVPEGQETSIDAKTRKVGGLRGFLNDDRRRWMKDELTGLKGYAGQFRDLKKSGELDLSTEEDLSIA